MKQQLFCLKMFFYVALIFTSATILFGSIVNIAKAEQTNSAFPTSPINTKEEAAECAKQMGVFPKNAEVTNIIKGVAPYDSWSVYFIVHDQDDPNENHGGIIILSSADGSMVGLEEGKWGDHTGWLEFSQADEKVSREQAVVIADHFIQQRGWDLNGNWIINPYPESRYETRAQDQSLHKIRYRLAHNGIPYDGHTFTIYIHRVTGEIISYQMRWSKVTYDYPDTIVSEKEAGDIFFKIVEPKLYILNHQDPSHLIYAISSFYTIDAMDGSYPEEYNYPHPETDDTLRSNIPAEYAKKLLLSMYDIELQYMGMDPKSVELYYRLLVKPSVPLFYTGPAPYLQAIDGTWIDFLGKEVTEPMPEASDWLIEILSLPEHLTYDVAVVLDGEALALNDEPVIYDDVTLVPLRELLDGTEATLSWDPLNEKTIVAMDGATIEFTINSDIAYVNGEPHALAVPAQIVHNRTYVPVRFFTEAFGAAVTWDAASRLVFINFAQSSTHPLTEKALKLLKMKAQENWEAKQSYQ